MSNINAYRNAIRKQIETLNRIGIAGQYIRWQIGSDEVRDATLVSLRAYGTREHTDVVLVAAGLDGIWQPLPRIVITLPTLSQVLALRKQYQVTT